MNFAWDPEKSAANLRERGFEFASRIFDCLTLEKEDHRHDYREARVIAVGRVDTVTLTVIYTDRSDEKGIVRRIVSARRSNRRERQAYEEAVED